MEIRLDGRTALITGGSKGIGLAIASTLVASGADVVIMARGEESLADAKEKIAEGGKGRVLAISCDVAKAEDVAEAFKAATSQFGKIDILVNNAGTSSTGKFEEVSDEVWQADLDLKLFAAIRLCRLVYPGMKERRWGRIINVLATAARAPRAGSAPTSISRAAGLALTKVLASEWAPHNVLVNALLTGLIRSDQHLQKALSNNIAPEEFYGKMAAPIPLGRVVKLSKFANIACFLASDAASYITGTAINVDGGSSPVA